jgi:hypothetical protein
MTVTTNINPRSHAARRSEPGGRPLAVSGRSDGPTACAACGMGEDDSGEDVSGEDISGIHAIVA